MDGIALKVGFEPYIAWEWRTQNTAIIRLFSALDGRRDQLLQVPVLSSPQ